MPDRKQAVPPLVLLPGTLCDERVFAPLLEELRELGPDSLETHIILTPGCTSLHGAAQQVLDLAPPRFAALGFSLGGFIALELATLAPDRILGLALLDVNAAPVPPETHAGRRAAVETAETLGHGRYVREQLWPSYVGPSCESNLDLQKLLSTMAEDLGHGAFSSQTEAALGRRDYRPLARTLHLPALVLAGEHDAIYSAEAQREFAAQMPHAEFVLIRDAGHFALLEQPAAVAASVAAWIHALSGGNNFD